MLKFYFISVFIYMFITFGGSWLFFDRIKENGWVYESKKTTVAKGIFTLVWISSVPIVRLLFAINIFIIASITKAEFEKMKSDLDELEDFEDDDYYDDEGLDDEDFEDEEC